ncbi:MAG: hypothetical protein DME89_06945 [Verrucomicrobia bacterium]|nr:MAG: hypothetical protein DME89_06945 [Verrucomicrobiota bacterium]
MAGESVKVADNVTAVPALLYWSHTTTAVAAACGEFEGCASAASLIDEIRPANDIFAASTPELMALCCPSANGITHTPSSKSR